MKNLFIIGRAGINTGLAQQPNPQLEQRRKELLMAQKAAAIAGKKVSSNSNVVKNYKLCLPSVLPTSIFAILLGHVLADGNIKYDNMKDQACIKFEYGNHEYALAVYTSLSDYVLSPPKAQTRINVNGNAVTTYCFQTVTLPRLVIFHHLFVEAGVKTIPTGLILYLLTPQALATWYMDDGSQTDYRPGHGQGIQLHTHCFNVDTMKQVVLELNVKFDLECYVRLIPSKGNTAIIVIPSRSYPKFHSLVKNYMYSSMIYKLPTPK